MTLAKMQVDEDAQVHVGGHRVAEALQHGPLEAGAGDGRQRLERPRQRRLAAPESTSSSAPDATSPSRISAMQRVDVHVHRQPQDVVDEAGDRRPDARAGSPSSTSSVTVSPGVTPSTSAEHLRQHDARTAASGSARPSRSTMRLKRGSGGTPVIGEIALAMAGRGCARRRLRCGSTATTPGRRASAMRAASAARLDEGDGDVLPLGDPELRLDQPLDRVGEDEADHQNRHGEGDAEDRRRRAQRMAHHVAQHHAPGGAEVRATTRRFERSSAGSAPALRAASPRPAARAPRGAPREKAPRAGRDERQDRRAHDDASRNAEEQHGKAEELVVEPDDQRPEPRAGRRCPITTPDRADDQRPLQVVPADRRVAVAERLERGNLRPLQRQRARERDVQDERGDQQKDRAAAGSRSSGAAPARSRPSSARAAARAESRPARRTARACRSSRAIASSAATPGRQRQHDVVEAALHVEGRSQRLPIHPEDAEPLVVRHELAGTDAVDVLGRQRHADDREAAQPAVDHRRHLIAGIQPVRDRRTPRWRALRRGGPARSSGRAGGTDR